MKKWILVAGAVATAIGVCFAAGIAGLIYLAVAHNRGVGLAQQGYEAMAGKDYDEAIACFDAALKKPVGDYQRSYVYLNRGAAYNFKGRFDEAIRDNTRALQLNHELPSAYVGRGFAYQQKGELDKAIADLDEAIRRDPNSGPAYYNRGYIFYDKKEMDRALADFNEAVRCSPDDTNNLIMRGLCYLAKDDLDHALINFDAAAAIDPGNARALSERRRIHERKGEHPKIPRAAGEPGLSRRGKYRSAGVSKRPRVVGPLERSAQLQVKRLPLLDEKLVHRPSKSYSGLIIEAESAYEAGEFDRAIDLNNIALGMEIGPAQASIAVMNRGNAYRAKADLEAALRDYNEAITLDPKNGGAYVDRGLVLSQKGEFDDADKDYREALQLNPDQWQAYFDRASNYREEGRLDEAMADLNSVTELNPGAAGAYINRGSIHFQKGEMEEAIKEYTKAIKVDPNSVDAYTSRARAHVHKKEYAEAVNDLKKVAALNPKEPAGALNSLAWFYATCPEARVRDGSKAVAAATKACELTHWKEWGHIDTLAAAYAEAGKFQEAVKYQKQALEMVSKNQSDLVEGARKRLSLYQQHRPYREEP